MNMQREQIHLWIDKELLKTSNNLQNTAMVDDELVFFRLKSNSKNSWYCFVFEMGLVAIRQHYEKFKKNLEEE